MMSRSGFISMALLLFLFLAVAASSRLLGDYRRQCRYQHVNAERIMLEEQALSLLALEGSVEFTWEGYRWYRHAEGDAVVVGTERDMGRYEMVFRNGQLIERRRGRRTQ